MSDNALNNSLIGFIGAGRMATALARGCVQSGLQAADCVIASAPSLASRERFAEEIPGAATTEDNAEVLAKADVIVLSVKPQKMPEVLAGLRDRVEQRHLLVSVAAGIRLEAMAAALPEGTRLIRVMPNTPCLVGQGACGFARFGTASQEDGEIVEKILGSVGDVHEVNEEQLDAVCGVSGSGPAFIYTVIEALASGGVAGGLNEELALKLAIQTTRGAAEMLAATGSKPEELRNQVTSPGGTTLAGLEALARNNGAAALQSAVESATKRSIELGQ